jgi:murein DD-endopeptidase MepM/ murein hydrolase activator NlpD
MLSQNVPERQKNRRYTVVLVPEGETRKPLTVSFSILGLMVVVCGTILVVMSLVVAAVLYTPLGSRLPIHNAELEQRYGRQIVGIQEQLRSLGQEMTVLRAYNIKLRRALGENIDARESAASQFIMSDSLQNAIKENSDTTKLQSPDDITVQERSDLTGAGARLVSSTDDRGSAQDNHRIEFPLLQPVEGFMTRGFDPGEFHYGIDYAGKQGNIVLAASDGNIVFAGWTYDNGFMVILSHEAGLMTIYKHNKALLKYAGATVKRGEPIALLGNTGITSSGFHLHFEVWKNGVVQNPNNFLLNIQ